MAKTSFSSHKAAAQEPAAEEKAPASAAKSAVKTAVKTVAPAKADPTPPSKKTFVKTVAPKPVPESQPKMVEVKTETLESDEVHESLEADDRTLSVPTTTGVEGYVDRSMFEIPSLKLVQSIGPNSEKFEAGIFILNGELPLCDPEGPISLVILRIKVDFEENLPWGSEDRPRVFANPDEVAEAGGWTDWIDNKKPPFSPRAVALVAIMRPEGLEDDPSFPFEDEDGNAWALALWTLKSTSFTTAAKKILTAAEFGLKGKLHYGVWDVATKREQRGGNLVWCPKPTRQAQLLSDATAAYLLSLGS